jgi:hypothetical protein
MKRKMPIENRLALVQEAKDKKPNADWLKQAKELKEMAVTYRQQQAQKVFEKLPRLDLRGLGGSEEDPVAIKVKAIDTPHSVQTDKMERAMDVFNAEVLLVSEEGIKINDKTDETIVKGGRYSLWENTVVIKNEMDAYIKEFGENGSIEEQEFIIASYGRVPSKKKGRKPTYVFRVFPA